MKNSYCRHIRAVQTKEGDLKFVFPVVTNICPLHIVEDRCQVSLWVGLFLYCLTGLVTEPTVNGTFIMRSVDNKSFTIFCNIFMNRLRG